MRALKMKFALIGLAAFGLLLSGCLLSGTFVIDEDFSFTAASGFYFYPVDVTSEPDWEDHKDNIDMIDVVGFEMTMNNANPGDVTFSVYVAPTAATQQYDTKGELDDNAYVVIDDLTVPAGTSTMTYAASLGKLKNLAKLKELAKTGKFHYYGVAEGMTSETFTVDPGKIIITVSASK